MSDDEYGFGDADDDALVAAASAVESEWTETQRRSQQPPAAAAAPARAFSVAPAPARPAVINGRTTFTGFGGQGRGDRATTPSSVPARPAPPPARPKPPESTFDVAPPDLDFDEESGAYKALPKPAAPLRPAAPPALAPRPPPPGTGTGADDLRAKFDALQRTHAQQEQRVKALQREKERKDGESANIRRKWEVDKAGWEEKETRLTDELAKATALVAELQRLNQKREADAATEATFRRNELESAAVKRRLRNTGATASQRPSSTALTVPPLTVSPRRRPPIDVSPRRAESQQPLASAGRARHLDDDTPAGATRGQGKGRAMADERVPFGPAALSPRRRRRMATAHLAPQAMTRTRMRYCRSRTT